MFFFIIIIWCLTSKSTLSGACQEDWGEFKRTHFFSGLNPLSGLPVLCKVVLPENRARQINVISNAKPFFWG